MGKAVGGIVGAVGSYYGAKRAADAARDAGIRSEQARQRAMEEARFKPFAMTTKFGTATPEFDAQGRLSGYTYGATPLYAGYQTQLDRPGQLAMEGIQRAADQQPQYEQAAQGLFSLGQSMMPGTTVQDLASQILEQRYAAREPEETKMLEQLARTGYGRGTAGLRVGGGNPMLDEYLKGREERRRGDELEAMREAQQRVSFGAGLLGTAAQTQGLGYSTQTGAYQPFLQALQTQQAIETAAQQPMNLGVDFGQRVSDAGYRIGSLDLSGTGMANQNYTTAGYMRGGALAGLGQGLGSSISGMSNPFSGLMGSSSNPMNIGVANSGLFGTNMFNRQFTQGSTLGNMTGGYSPYKS